MLFTFANPVVCAELEGWVNVYAHNLLRLNPHKLYKVACTLLLLGPHP